MAGTPLASLEILVLIVSAPLLVFPSSYSFVALLLLPAIWLARLVARRNTLRRTPADWPLVGLVLMTLVSLYPSVDLSASRPKLYGLLLGFYIFGLVAEHLRTESLRKALAFVLVVGGVGIALLGVLGTEWKIQKFSFLGPLYDKRPQLITEVQTSFGTLKEGFHPNEVGGILTLLLLFAIGLAVFSQHRTARFMLAGTAVLMFGTLALTASRSAILGAGVSIVILTILRWPRLLLPLTAALFGLAAVLWGLGAGNLASWIIEMDVATGSSIQGRPEIWIRSYAMMQDFFFTGIGLNTFPIVSSTLYPFFLVAPSVQLPHAHNLFLQIALDLGVPGLVSFLGLLGVAVISLVRWSRLSMGWERGLAAGLGFGLLAHFIFGLTDAMTLGAKPGAFLWAMLGTAVALGASARERASPEANSNPQFFSENVEEQPSGEGQSKIKASPVGVGLLQLLQWALFSVACGLGVYIAVTNATVLH